MNKEKTKAKKEAKQKNLPKKKKSGSPSKFKFPKSNVRTDENYDDAVSQENKEINEFMLARSLPLSPSPELTAVVDSPTQTLSLLFDIEGETKYFKKKSHKKITERKDECKEESKEEKKEENKDGSEYGSKEGSEDKSQEEKTFSRPTTTASCISNNTDVIVSNTDAIVSNKTDAIISDNNSMENDECDNNNYDSNSNDEHSITNIDIQNNSDSTRNNNINGNTDVNESKLATIRDADLVSSFDASSSSSSSSNIQSINALNCNSSDKSISISTSTLPSSSSSHKPHICVDHPIPSPSTATTTSSSEVSSQYKHDINNSKSQLHNNSKSDNKKSAKKKSELHGHVLHCLVRGVFVAYGIIFAVTFAFCFANAYYNAANNFYLSPQRSDNKSKSWNRNQLQLFSSPSCGPWSSHDGVELCVEGELIVIINSISTAFSTASCVCCGLALIFGAVYYILTAATGLFTSGRKTNQIKKGGDIVDEDCHCSEGESESESDSEKKERLLLSLLQEIVLSLPSPSSSASAVSSKSLPNPTQPSSSPSPSALDLLSELEQLHALRHRKDVKSESGSNSYCNFDIDLENQNSTSKLSSSLHFNASSMPTSGFVRKNSRSGKVQPL